MKPYFAKLIPVEKDSSSNIWQWNNYINNTGWEYISDSDMDAIIAHGLRPAPEFRKVKLFLCSRDIQVGDEVRLGNMGNTHGIADEHNYLKNLGAFKVIGEISQEATWVKEGDEFDEEQIRWKTWNKYDYSLIPLNKIEWEHWNPEGAIFAVIGPCGRFH